MIMHSFRPCFAPLDISEKEERSLFSKQLVRQYYYFCNMPFVALAVRIMVMADDVYMQCTLFAERSRRHKLLLHYYKCRVLLKL